MNFVSRKENHDQSRANAPAHCTFDPEDWLRLARCWHPVARAEDIGAAPVKAVLLDEPLVIYRIKGQVVVARDVCPHRGVPLTLGFHDEEGIVCPYHGLRFGEDGRCNRIPSSPDRPVPAKLNLTCYAVEERYGLIWTCLAFDAENPLPLPTLPHWDDEGFQQINCPAFEVNGFAGRQVEGFSMLPTLPGSIPTPLQIPIISWFPTISRRRPPLALPPITGVRSAITRPVLNFARRTASSGCAILSCTCPLRRP
jgi:nitrite reductase/ring-hydroxylating ferredoxin subunit